MMPSSLSPILVSACLVGLCTRYDQHCRPSEQCLQYLHGQRWVPFCPEQLGGLPTPREAADISGGDGVAVLRGHARVITKSGGDVTDSFLRGAGQALLLAQLQQATTAILKARSPSCAVNGVIGVTAALFRQHGLQLLEW